jgi:hypothetical protein
MIDLVGFGGNLRENRFRVYIWGLSDFGQIPPNLSYFLGCFLKIKDTNLSYFLGCFLKIKDTNLSYFLGCFLKIKDTWSTSYFGLSSTGRSVETQTEHLKKKLFPSFLCIKNEAFLCKYFVQNT